MIPTPTLALHVRSYAELREADRHTYAQLVLPLSGAVRLEIEGRENQVDPLRAAFVAPGAWHSQCAAASNRSLILDVDLGAIAAPTGERLLDRPFLPVGPAARKLVEFMALMAERQAATPAVVSGWAPLLLDTLAGEVPAPPSRLAALLARIEAEPGLAWSTDTMARCAGLSQSRLHALFREELDTTPHEWLLRLRLARVCAWLAESNRPIAELALCAGFSDQSALTRAMRQVMDTTPGAYRWRERELRVARQENPSKTQ